MYKLLIVLAVIPITPIVVGSVALCRYLWRRRKVEPIVETIIDAPIMAAPDVAD